MRSLLFFGAFLVLAALAGCSGEVKEAKDADGGPSGSAAGTSADVGDPGCVSNRTYFAREVWNPVLGKICIECHGPGGIAAEQNAALLLQPSTYPGFLDANLENVESVLQIEVDGKPILLRKPLGEQGHGGGAQLTEDSDEYQRLVTLASRIEEGDTCTEPPLTASFDDVALLDARSTLRKVTLQLAGRLPTSAELDRIDADGEDALGPVIDGVLGEEAFFDRLKDIYNDAYLTDLYMRYVGFAINLLGDDDYPSAGMYYDDLDEDLRRKVNTAIAREPLELIAYVVRNDLPFSEILTADYTVVNPFSEMVYNTGASFSNPNDENEFVPAQVSIQREGGSIALPHAGVMTTPVFLNRFPTTRTNRNRHRARMVYDLFLATDVLAVGARPIDPTQSSKYNNPTRDDPQCTGCHRVIDPVAGAFMKWDENDQEQYEPDREWYPEVFPPGYGNEVMQTSDFPTAQRWLAQRIVADPRFVISVVHRMFKGIIGRDPLSYPIDPESDDFDARLTAWEVQDAVLRGIGDAFVADDMNLKTAVRELLLTPYFRATNATGPLDEARAVELSDVGTGRLSIPDRLARKIEAITGRAWARSWDSEDWLTRDFKILYGGIDSEAVTERLTTPNGIMANVGWRMANEVACERTAMDFNRPSSERLLFPHVTLLDVPETAAGHAVPEAVANIRRDIQHLHAYVLDEDLAEDDPEIDRTYQLFYDTWKEGTEGIAADTLNPYLDWQCQARLDPATGEELPDDQRLRDDPDYVVRSWMAVMTYLLADYRFLYE